MSDIRQRSDFELTPREFEELCEEEAKLRRKGEEVERRREVIEERLRIAIKNNREERTSIIREYRNAMRQQRKALAEEHAQQREQHLAQQRAGINGGALANLQSRIAALNEQTKEELHEEDKLAVSLRKADMRALRGRLSKTNGSGGAA